MNNQSFNIRNSEARLFLALAVTLSIIFLISFVFNLRSQRKDISVPSGVVSRPFDDVALKARAVYVYDLRSKSVLFAKNENIRLPLASLTKMMSALVAQDLSPQNGIITISREALATQGDNGLLADEKWSLKDILDFSLVSSSNDAMRAVALAVGSLLEEKTGSSEAVNNFVIEMNKKANQIGLKDTYFWNETGLDESSNKGGGYSSARDMSLLVEYILARQPDLLSATRNATTTIQSLDKHKHVAINTDTIVDEIPGLLISKTGFTNVAGGNMVVAFDPELGRPIIVVLLGSTEYGRFEDMRALIGATIDYINDK